MADGEWNLPRISRLLSEARGNRLQELPSPNTFREIQGYVKTLEDRLEHERSSSVRRAIREELAKIDAMLPEIKERRTRKIVREASDQALGMAAETQNLTQAEADGFEALVAAIRTFHQAVYGAPETGPERPDHHHVSSPTAASATPALERRTPTLTSVTQALPKMAAPPSPAMEPGPPDPKTASSPEAPSAHVGPEDGAWVIRITEEPPVLASPDGPWELKVGDIARLPEKLARILVEQGKADRIPQ